MKKTCVYCGKEFETNIKRVKYCSIGCRQERNKSKNKLKEKMIKKCDICGKEFITNLKKQKYCSKECRKKAMHIKVLESYKKNKKNKQKKSKVKKLNSMQKFFNDHCINKLPSEGIAICNSRFGKSGQEIYRELRKDYIKSDFI